MITAGSLTPFWHVRATPLFDVCLTASSVFLAHVNAVASIYRQVLKTVKHLETQGYSYEGADASVNLLVRRTMNGYVPPFQ